MEMTNNDGLIKPRTKISLGIIWFVIAIFYIADKFLNDLNIRLIDWVGWLAMFTTGAILIFEGIKLKANK